MKIWAIVFLSLFLFGTNPPAESPTERSIVQLVDLGNTAGGTGFELQYKDHQYTVTNNHVCDLAGPTQTMMGFSSLQPPIKLHVLYQSNEGTDLCILEPIKDAPVYRLAQKDFDPLQPAIVAGYPGLGPFTIIKAITWLKHDIEIDEVVIHGQYIRADIQPGNSGSPCFDKDGFVGGVVFAGNGYGAGVIVPLSDVKRFLDAYQSR